ncbi:MAG: GntR family transcriptional regulator [Chloroflexi bacterium]|nr:GntR family transcriptional regulator [Chloroflexota bacterium]
MLDARDTVFANHRIDPLKPVPYHVQVYQAIEQIIGASMRPGDQLPGEPRLCELFGVSRTVIRQALDQLLRDGLILRVMGKGTFVAEPKIPEGLVGSVSGFHEDMVAKGYTPVSRVLLQQRVKPTVKVARNLEISASTDVIELRRVRYVNGIPIQLVSNYLPYASCPSVLDADLTHRSLYGHMREKYGLEIARGKRIIEAVLANEEESGLLEVPIGAPLLVVDSVSFLADGTPIEYYHAVHRSDRARFEIEVARSRP